MRLLQVVKVIWLAHYRSSVGLSGSQQTLFYAPVTDSMKVSQGGGNAHEGEFIEVVEMKVDECLQDLLHNNAIERSIGLLFALLWFKLYKAAWDVYSGFLIIHTSTIPITTTSIDYDNIVTYLYYRAKSHYNIDHHY